MNYYNDIDPYCAAWLENLIKEKLIPDGKVDTRSIADVQPGDLDGFTQCHFFAGIGGWARALELARWGAGRPVWTASCPCQPFSVAGKRKGTADDRHLWPEFYRLVRACLPGVVMGEQVSGAAGLEWLDGVASDMEKEGYTCRAADIPACAVNAPHRRSRLYWVAYAQHGRLQGSKSFGEVEGRESQVSMRRRPADSGDTGGWAAHGLGAGLEGRQSERLDPRQKCEAVERGRSECERMDDLPEPRLGSGRSVEMAALRDASRRGEPERRERDGRVGDGDHGLGDSNQPGEINELLQRSGELGGLSGDPQADIGFWSDFALVGPDREGKWRRAKPLVCGMANGIQCGLDGLRSAILWKAKEEIIAYATISHRDPSEVLRAVREGFREKESWEAETWKSSPTGVRIKFSTEKVLFDFLFRIESALQARFINCSFPKAYCFDAEGQMRGMRIDDLDFLPSYRREPNEQSQRQCTNTLSTLSLILARCAEADWNAVRTAHARSIPLLAKGVNARAAKLRALGNAIVPPLAATFVAVVKEMIDAHEDK